MTYESNCVKFDSCHFWQNCQNVSWNCHSTYEVFPVFVLVVFGHFFAEKIGFFAEKIVFSLQKQGINRMEVSS